MYSLFSVLTALVFDRSICFCMLVRYSMHMCVLGHGGRQACINNA